MDQWERGREFAGQWERAISRQNLSHQLERRSLRKYRRHVSLFVWSDVSGAWKVQAVNEKAAHFLIFHLQELEIVCRRLLPLFCFCLMWFYLINCVRWGLGNDIAL